jgi:hypothetical protein
MKDEVLKRGMFSQPMSKSARNSGIMEGFEDEMEDEGTPPLARSPQNPEILMNNLRGDIRSVDARYLELAQMVGEEAAMETPPEVLAMLQSQLAAQSAPAMPQGGIGALPQGAQMAPPPMMGQGPAMPPGMEGMPPFPQGGAEQAPPQTFAGGGDVSATGELTLQFGNSSPFGNSNPFGNGDMFGSSMPFSGGMNSGGTTFLGRLQENQAQERVTPSASPLFQGTTSPSQSVNILMPSGAQQPTLTQDIPSLTGYTSKPLDAQESSTAPFGTEQAPPTPDGMPPLRAAGGTLVSEGARLASQGFGKISSALTPYMTRGIEYLDELVTPFLRPGMRVEPLTQDGRRAVIQSRENIVQGPRGPEMGKGTRLEAANTLNMGRVPFSQAIRNDPFLNSVGNVVRRNPKLTALGTAVTAADIALYNNLTSPNAAPRSAEELAQVNALINQIPPQGPPLRDAEGNLITSPEQGGSSSFLQKFAGDPRQFTYDPATRNLPVTSTQEAPVTTTPGSTETAPSEEAPAQPSLLQRLVGDKNQFTYDPNLLGRTQEGIIPKKDDTTQFVKDNIFKTRGERIRAEYKDIEPTFRELLGDTKADARTNALLLLADAGFKFASTYKPTMAMALSESLSGVPKGFAAIVAQAKDRDIKIKTAVLQEAVNSINMQDKVARDLQLKDLEIQGRLANTVLQARSREQLESIRANNAQILENIKGGNTRSNTILTNDLAVQLELVKNQGLVEKDGGMGLTVVEDRKGSFLGTYIKPDANGKLPPAVQSSVGSRWTLREIDNPFVENLGVAPTTVETDKAERIKLGRALQQLDNSLKTFDNLRGQYADLYSPGTWFQDKINNIIVPISGGLVRPDVKQAAAAQQIQAGLNQVQKSIASANDSGRIAVQEQEWARDILGDLTNPTEFFTNKEVAAKRFATMEAQLRNARQNVLTQLGFVDNDYVMKTPQTGTSVDPFVIPADPEGQRRMFTYLGSTIGTLQDPKAVVYLRMPNGRTDAFTPTQLKGLIQK